MTFEYGIRKNGTRCRCDKCDVYIRDYRDEWWSEGGQDGPFCKACYDYLAHNDEIITHTWCNFNNSNNKEGGEE